MPKITTLIEIGRTFGARDGALRLGYELERGTGLMSRRMRSVQGWERWTLQQIAPQAEASEVLRSRRAGERPFFFEDVRELATSLRDIAGPDGEERARAEANHVLEGNLPFFGSLSYACGFPPNWFQNPVTGQKVSPERGWTTMRFASPDYGDLKFILEPSRFLFVHPLARAYALIGDESFPEAFWHALEDWAHNSPPMAGPLWICGQESSLRIFAWSFALRAFLHSPATTPERCALLFSMIAAHAWRTEQTLGYARSQRSNHLISEAAGLWTVGALYPELASAAAWRDLGASLLREAVLDQFTADGLYLQHSFNYQRMALHLLLWTLRLAQVLSLELPAQITSRTAAGLDFLGSVVDPISGRAPNHGANDGSLVLPLAACDYRDFRPLLQLGATVLDRPPLFEPGPWDETSLWLCGHAPDSASRRPPRVPSASTGYYRLGDEDSWALVHASRYARRPFQADQLHVDLWWNGLNLARDAGTYLYNGAPPWDNGLSRSLVHNTVTLDGRDQMRRAGRFLWVDWAQASGISSATSKSAVPDYFEGEHDGYRRLGATHRRSVQYLPHAGWVILDDVLGNGEHGVRLHWLLPDLPLEIISESPLMIALTTRDRRFRWSIFASSPPASVIIREGRTSQPDPDTCNIPLLGWESPTYGLRRPANSLVCWTRGQLPVRLITSILAAEEFQAELARDTLIVSKDGVPIYEVKILPGDKPRRVSD